MKRFSNIQIVTIIMGVIIAIGLILFQAKDNFLVSGTSLLKQNPSENVTQKVISKGVLPVIQILSD